MYVDVRQRGL